MKCLAVFSAFKHTMFDVMRNALLVFEFIAASGIDKEPAMGHITGHLHKNDTDSVTQCPMFGMTHEFRFHWVQQSAERVQQCDLEALLLCLSNGSFCW
jgi:hypothetical protein